MDIRSIVMNLISYNKTEDNTERTQRKLIQKERPWKKADRNSHSIIEITTNRLLLDWFLSVSLNSHLHIVHNTLPAEKTSFYLIYFTFTNAKHTFNDEKYIFFNAKHTFISGKHNTTGDIIIISILYISSSKGRKK